FSMLFIISIFFFQAEDGIRDRNVTGVQTCALPISFLFSDYTAGAELAEKKEVDIDVGVRMILTYAGDKNFTLVEEKRDTIPTLSSTQEDEGDIVNLVHTIGVLTNNCIEWFYKGINYYLASDEVTKDELINIAQSVTAKEVK